MKTTSAPLLETKRTLIVLGAIFVFMLFVCWGRFQLPAFWDEPKIYFSQLFNLLRDPLYHFTGPVTVFDRPPGVHLLYIPWMAIFGDSILVIRILSFVYFTAGLAFFFIVISSQSLNIAMLAVGLFMLTPLVQVYAVQYVGDPQLFFLFALYLYLLSAHPKKWWVMAAVGFLAGLTREPALALIPATLGFIYWRDRKLSIVSVLVAFSPLFGLSIHLVRNMVRAGTPLNHLTILEGHLDLLASLDLRYRNLVSVIFATYRLLPLVLLALGCLVLKWRKIKVVPLDVFAIILVAGYFVIFSGVKICLPRYVMPAIPFFIYLLLRCCLVDLTKVQLKVLILFVLGAPLVIGNPNVKNGNVFYHFTGYQDTLQYPRIIQIHQEALLKTNSSLQAGDTVQTSWPFMEMLRSDKLGYGPVKELNVTWSPLTLPDAILWTDFPEQIPREEIVRTLQQGEYESQTWRYEDYVVELHVKKRILP